MMSGRNRSPFTASQWQELEHQALIFKYIVSGVPIPHDLICTVKRSLDSSLSSRLFPHQPIGWGCFQMGFGRKADPEPGRCRRTDGKKWRCSKEAYPDSKYCERHMHRGKNRSRKPVEVISAANPSPTISSITSLPPSSTTSSYSLSPLSSSVTSETPHHPHLHQIPYSPNTTSLYPFLYPHPPSSSRPPPPPSASCLSPQPNNTHHHHHLFLDSGSYSEADRYYRHHHHGMREGTVDERPFFPEASGTVRGLHDSYNPLTVSSSKQEYSEFQYQSLADHNPKQQHQHQHQQEQHCFVLGTDFKSLRPMKTERDDEPQKPLHHFFGEWAPKNRDSWLDLEEDPPTTHHGSFSTTQLSISIPMSSQKLLASESRIQTDG